MWLGVSRVTSPSATQSESERRHRAARVKQRTSSLFISCTVTAGLVTDGLSHRHRHGDRDGPRRVTGTVWQADIGIPDRSRRTRKMITDDNQRSESPAVDQA